MAPLTETLCPVSPKSHTHKFSPPVFVGLQSSPHTCIKLERCDVQTTLKHLCRASKGMFNPAALCWQTSLPTFMFPFFLQDLSLPLLRKHTHFLLLVLARLFKGSWNVSNSTVTNCGRAAMTAIRPARPNLGTSKREQGEKLDSVGAPLYSPVVRSSFKSLPSNWELLTVVKYQIIKNLPGRVESSWFSPQIRPRRLIIFVVAAHKCSILTFPSLAGRPVPWRAGALWIGRQDGFVWSFVDMI